MRTRTKLVFASSVVSAFGLGIAATFFIAPATFGVHLSASPERKVDVPKAKVPRTLPNFETASLSSWVINYGAVGPLRLKISIPDAARQLGITDWRATWFPNSTRIDCAYFPLAGSGAPN